MFVSGASFHTKNHTIAILISSAFYTFVLRKFVSINLL